MHLLLVTNRSHADPVIELQNYTCRCQSSSANHQQYQPVHALIAFQHTQYDIMFLPAISAFGTSAVELPLIAHGVIFYCDLQASAANFLSLGNRFFTAKELRFTSV